MQRLYLVMPAFFLGVASVVPNVVMEVKYTNLGLILNKEGAAVEALSQMVL